VIITRIDYAGLYKGPDASVIRTIYSIGGIKRVFDPGKVAFIFATISARLTAMNLQRIRN